MPPVQSILPSLSDCRARRHDRSKLRRDGRETHGKASTKVFTTFELVRAPTNYSRVDVFRDAERNLREPGYGAAGSRAGRGGRRRLHHRRVVLRTVVGDSGRKQSCAHDTRQTANNPRRQLRGHVVVFPLACCSVADLRRRKADAGNVIHQSP